MGQGPVPAPASLASPSEPQKDHYLGVGSCASPACHGGPASAANDNQRGKWNSAYTVWVEKDKHAKAYSVLYSPESRKILRNLDHLDAAAEPRPYLDDRCLACHATVAKGPQEAPGTMYSLPAAADGVGCEACHGAARGWLVEHAARTWIKTDPATHRDTHGPSADNDGRMVNTRDMAVRASVCVDCHIGCAGADGLPARNMDHDMIAAGHPRLTFEMSAFLANMPHHWDDSEEKSRDDYSAHAWAVGQVVSTQAALRLLAARAKAAETPPAGKAEAARWPEFSEYDCFTCHHGLALDSYRQKIGKAGEAAKLGRYAWGTWYLPMTRLLLKEGPAGPANATGIDRVVELLRDPVPKPSAVRAAADAAAREMQPLLDGARRPATTGRRSTACCGRPRTSRPKTGTRPAASTCSSATPTPTPRVSRSRLPRPASCSSSRTRPTRMVN